jgi:hypothetical protein
MLSIPITSSISTTSKKQTYTTSFQAQYPEFQSLSEVYHIFTKKELLALLNLINKTCMISTCKDLARLLPKGDLLSKSYKIFQSYPLQTQQRALELYEQTPSILDMFSFSSSIKDPTTPSSKATPKAKTKQKELPTIVSTVADQLAAITL